MSFGQKIEIRKYIIVSHQNAFPCSVTQDTWAHVLMGKWQWLGTKEGMSWSTVQPTREEDKWRTTVSQWFTRTVWLTKLALEVLQYLHILYNRGQESQMAQDLPGQITRVPPSSSLQVATNQSHNLFFGVQPSSRIIGHGGSIIDPRQGKLYWIWYQFLSSSTESDIS